MNRTGAGLLIPLAVVGGAVGYLVDVALAARGSAVFVPPASFAAALLVVAIAAVAAGWRVRGSVRGRGGRRLDPFVAMRTLVLGRAASRAGALLVGFASGILVYLSSQTGVPAGPAFWLSGLALGAAILCTAAGLLVEQWCRVPPGPRDDPDDTPYEEAHR